MLTEVTTHRLKTLAHLSARPYHIPSLCEVLIAGSSRRQHWASMELLVGLPREKDCWVASPLSLTVESDEVKPGLCEPVWRCPAGLCPHRQGFYLALAGCCQPSQSPRQLHPVTHPWWRRPHLPHQSVRRAKWTGLTTVASRRCASRCRRMSRKTRATTP